MISAYEYVPSGSETPTNYSITTRLMICGSTESTLSRGQRCMMESGSIYTTG